ncbi:hypothetical protein L2E82_49490 [Cichorium intybus]|uniref:Uncharacterized protein n=1 Tax=Cichorium intybus TaxID=13427 RepID=A0ACB8Z1Y0_CICIN|nr:hypothetical protein L2E82_49490 [Cichorium intybus]
MGGRQNVDLKETKAESADSTGESTCRSKIRMIWATDNLEMQFVDSFAPANQDQEVSDVFTIFAFKEKSRAY